MEAVQVISEFVIQTLKEFSCERKALNVESLSNALSSNGEIISFLDPLPTAAVEIANNSGRSSQKLAPVSLTSTKPSQQSDFLLFFRKLRSTFKAILAAIEPLAREEDLQRSSELKQRLEACHTLESLADHGDDLVVQVNSTYSRAYEQIEFANEFLSELSDHLLGMETQLFTYQSHNRETYAIQDKFCDSLLSQTAEMNQAVRVTKGLEEIRNLIANRLSIIGKAIETKREEDENRLREADTKIAELQSSVRDYNEEILQVKERADALEKEVMLDSLMEIHNRRAYDLRIREDLRYYHRTGQVFSLILIDVDRFKAINDQYGHRAGDKCLQEIANIVAHSLRKSDFLARYGGEELVAVLPGTTATDAQSVAEKIRIRIDRTRFHYQEAAIPLTISLGVTEVQSTDTDPEMPFVRVDEAMYCAKREGRNRVCVV
ncbi:MAG: GGDEF domain-containing protein [Syntrophobacteraceae bacterium]